MTDESRLARAFQILNNSHLKAYEAGQMDKSARTILDAVDKGEINLPPLRGFTPEGHELIFPSAVRVGRERGIVRLKKAAIGPDGLPHFPGETLPNGDATTDDNNPLTALL